MIPSRRIEIAPDRLSPWIAGFAKRHGPIVVRRIADGLVLSGGDDASAVIHPWGRVSSLRARGDAVRAEVGDAVRAEVGDAATATVGAGPGAAGADPVAEAVAAAGEMCAVPGELGVILVRRGGYAVGQAHGQTLVSHRCGTRYVQSRTAKGGWSQQRFARRRANQSDELVRAVADQAHRLLVASPEAGAAPPVALVVGGDERLVEGVLGDPRLRRLAALPRRTMFDLKDPRFVVLVEAVRRADSVRIDVADPTWGRQPAESASTVGADTVDDTGDDRVDGTVDDAGDGTVDDTVDGTRDDTVDDAGDDAGDDMVDDMVDDTGR